MKYVICSTISCFRMFVFRRFCFGNRWSNGCGDVHR